MLTKYHVRLSATNSRGNTLVKNINFTAQVEISYADLNSVICHLVKGNYSYDIEKGWKLSKTAKVLTFEEALIAIRDFRFIESHIEEEEEEETKSTYLCTIVGNSFSITNWHSNWNSFCAIATSNPNDYTKLKTALLNAGFKESKTVGTFYITGNYIVYKMYNGDTGEYVINLVTHSTITKKVNKRVEL